MKYPLNTNPAEEVSRAGCMSFQIQPLIGILTPTLGLWALDV